MIDDWRGQIDEVDRKILGLLNRRAELIHRIGREKRAQDLPLRVLEREDEILRLARKENPGPFSTGAVERIFRLIIAESRSLEEEVIRSDCGDEARGDPGADRGGKPQAPGAGV